MFQVRKKLETGDTWKGKAQNEKENITNPTLILMKSGDGIARIY